MMIHRIRKSAQVKSPRSQKESASPPLLVAVIFVAIILVAVILVAVILVAIPSAESQSLDRVTSVAAVL